jgi:hypothetical protein
MTETEVRSDDPVGEAALQFLEDLMPVLRSKCPGEDDRPLELPGPFATWAPDLELSGGSRLFRPNKKVYTAEQQCAARILGELWQDPTPALQDLIQAMEQDPKIGPRLDHAVMSTGGGGTTWQAQGQVQLLIDHALEMAGGFDLETAQRDSWITRWVRALRRH